MKNPSLDIKRAIFGVTGQSFTYSDVDFNYYDTPPEAATDNYLWTSTIGGPDNGCKQDPMVDITVEFTVVVKSPLNYNSTMNVEIGKSYVLENFGVRTELEGTDFRFMAPTVVNVTPVEQQKEGQQMIRWAKVNIRYTCDEK